jgi:hypothetical protein
MRTSIVDEDVDGPEGIHGSLHAAAGELLCGDVAGYRDSLAAALADLCGNLQ